MVATNTVPLICLARNCNLDKQNGAVYTEPIQINHQSILFDEYNGRIVSVLAQEFVSDRAEAEEADVSQLHSVHTECDEHTILFGAL